MITEEEKKEIINTTIEKILLIIPETIGNLMASHATMHKINAKFYKDYPEFKDKKNIVSSVIEMIEGKNPLESYEKILEKAVPEIRNRIKVTSSLNMQDITKCPDRDMKSLVADFDKSNNGIL